MAGTEPLCARPYALDAVSPADQQVLDRRAGVDLDARLLDRGGRGPANTSVMAPFKARCAA